jgi:glutaredoxin
VPTAPPRITVYGSACPACTQAKAVLDRHGIRYSEESMAALPHRFGHPRSMPQITVDDELLGGIDALLKLGRSGGLEHLARAGGEPWVQVKRRLGRGFDVIVRDRLGRETWRTGVTTRHDAVALSRQISAGRSG